MRRGTDSMVLMDGFSAGPTVRALVADLRELPNVTPKRRTLVDMVPPIARALHHLV